MQECKPAISQEAATSFEDDEDAAVSKGMPNATQTPPSYFRGAGFALIAITIWSGWFVSTRFDVTSNLTAYDLVALRFGVSALVLLPVVIRLRAGIGLVGWPIGLALFAGSGVPYSLLSTSGVAFAPAEQGAVLTPGVMPLATALLGVIILKERLSRVQIWGLTLILAGVIVITGLSSLHDNHGEWIGHIFFITGAFLFAGYTVALRGSRLSGFEAAAIVAFWSSVVYLPVYLISLHPHIFEVNLTSLLFPAFYQGVLTNVVSLAGYGRAVAVLGASRAAPFAALIPAVTSILGIVLLGEWPTSADWAGIGCVSFGVYLAAGGPLPPTFSKNLLAKS